MKNIKLLVVFILIVILSGCITSGLSMSGSNTNNAGSSNPQIVTQYNDKSNSTTYAYYLMIKSIPKLYPQISQVQDNTTKEYLYLLSLQITNDYNIKIFEYNQMTYIVDDQRFDFYGAPVHEQDIFNDTAFELTSFLSSKPDIGDLFDIQAWSNDDVYAQNEEITDLNPEETKEMILNLISKIVDANSITIKLFNNNKDETLEYNFTEFDIIKAKEIAAAVQTASI